VHLTQGISASDKNIKDLKRSIKIEERFLEHCQYTGVKDA